MEHGTPPNNSAESEPAKPMDHSNLAGMEPGKSPETKEKPVIKPGETFRYEFTLRQYGTHMYHSHHDEMSRWRSA